MSPNLGIGSSQSRCHFQIGHICQQNLPGTLDAAKRPCQAPAKAANTGMLHDIRRHTSASGIHPVKRGAAMRGLFRHALVATGASVVLLIPATGAAATSGGPVLIWSPTTSAGTYSFGTLDAGQTASQTFTLINSGGTATAALSVTVTGPSAFTKLGDTCTGAKLKPNTSCNVTIHYAPSSAGQNDSVTLTATSGKPSATASLTVKGASAKASPGIATSPSAGGTVGATTVKDTATLSGGSA